MITRPLASDADSLRAAVEDHAGDIWDLMRLPNTYVYLAGPGKVAGAFDRIMQKVAGGQRAWDEQKDAMRAQGRWAELIYN